MTLAELKQSLLVEWRKQPSVSGIAISLLVSGLTMDILTTFCGVFMVHSVKLMLTIFEFRVLNVTCLKHFTRYGHYTGEIEDSHRQTWSCLLNGCGKN